MEQPFDLEDARSPEVAAERAAGIDDPSSPHYAGHRAGDPRCGLGLGGPCTCEARPVVCTGDDECPIHVEPEDYDGYIDWLQEH